MQSVSMLLLTLAVLAPSAAFRLNTHNTTAYGPPWSDVIISAEVDFVACQGDYALCYYANCSTKPRTTSAWTDGKVATVDCPCEKHTGLFHVDINAILDEDSWRATRQACPLGMISCPLPNKAPVCHSINSNTLYAGSGITPSLISTFSNANQSSHGGGKSLFFPDSTDCTHLPGQYAGCMTAPCHETATGGTVCECPVFTGPFQVGGKDKSCHGIPSAAFTPRAPKDGGDYSLVPDHTCTSSMPVCYQGTAKALRSVRMEDPLNCVGQNATKFVRGACRDYGYGVHLGLDPVFRQTSIWKEHRKAAPEDVIERCESRSKRWNATGRTALIITTSHNVLGPENCTNCKSTGVASPEFTVPFYIWEDAGVNVTLASIKGGNIPVDEMGKYMTHWDTRFWRDASAIQRARHSVPISTLDFTQYDMVYMAGGWGAAWDLGQSTVLADGVTAAYKAQRVLGSVCHGALGFIQATAPDGKVLITGRNMTAVTDRQIEQLKVASITPLHPEDELKKRGAHYEASHGILTDIDQSLVVVDGSLVTGQNQNSACETAQRMLDHVAAW